MKRNVLALLVAVFLPVLLLACVSAADIFPKKDEGFLKGGLFRQIVEDVNKNQKSYLTEKNTISFYMDRGIASHYAGDYKSSIADLTEADRLIEEAYTLDISDYAEAFFKKMLKKWNTRARISNIFTLMYLTRSIIII